MGKGEGGEVVGAVALRRQRIIHPRPLMEIAIPFPWCVRTGHTACARLACYFPLRLYDSILLLEQSMKERLNHGDLVPIAWILPKMALVPRSTIVPGPLST